MTPKLLLAVFLATTIAGGAASAQRVDPDANWSSEFGRPGVEGVVLATIEYKGELIIAGIFELAADPPIRNIARWDGREWQPLGDGLPGPGLDTGEVDALTIYNEDLIAAGSFAISAGADRDVSVTWDGRRLDGSEAPAGAYFIRVDRGDASLTRRVVRFISR